MVLATQITSRIIDESRRALAQIEKKERRVLIRTGSFGRTTMRRNFRKRKKPSKPGQPPHVRQSGNRGLKLVRWALVGKQTVVIGPLKFNTSTRSSKPTPQLLEEGGTARIKTGSEGTATARFRPRPFRDKTFRPTRDFMLRILKD